MGRWTRQELEDAFEHYQEQVRQACASGDWNLFADLFAEDATYVEHLFGRMEGREAIRAWITGTMAQWPGSEMNAFPIGWYIVDEDRGWIACEIFNRMRDPGDGSVHEQTNLTLLKYAGDNQWAYEEDAYNPQRFVDMISKWNDVKSRIESGERPVDAAP
ncbi:MAG TPA: nuclear transport factor 2 family protein [Actinomycetota bacterium]|nr:nuclear transport factor 2 family protein [Actinomycetota bacterium]